MQRDDVRLRRNLVGPDVTAKPFELGRAMDVVADHAAAEPSHDPTEDDSDPAGADHSHGAAVEVETHEAVELEIAVARAVVGPWNLAIERQEQGDGELGHGVRRVVGDPHDLDAESCCRVQVDLVEAGRARRHQLRAAGRKMS